MQMQLGKNFNKLLHNKYVLYIVLFLAITNILGYLTIGDWNSLVLFIVLGVLSTHFSKNMIINLSIAMIGTNFIFAGLFVANILFGCGRVKEGMDGKKDCKMLKDNETCGKNTNCKWNEAVKAVKAGCVSK